MSRWIIPFLVSLTLFLVIESYAFQVIKTLTKNRWLRGLWLLPSLLAYLNFYWVLFTSDRSDGQTKQFQWAVGFLLVVLLPKILLVLVLLGEDIVRWVRKGISAVASSPTRELGGRRKFISQLALGIAAIPLASILYGIFKGKYNFKVLTYE